MLKKLLAAAALAALSSPALAGDVLPAIKAPAYQSTPCVVGTTATPTSCSGFYLGAGMGGVGTNADIIGNGINGSVFAGGGIPMIDAGYQYVQGNWTFGGEVSAGGQVSTNTSSAAGNGTQNGFFAYEVAKAGGNIAGLFGNSAPVSIPPALASSFITAGAILGAAQHQFGSHLAEGWVSGAFADFDVSSHWFLEIKYMNVQYGSQQSGALTFDSENIVKVSANYKF